MGAYIFLLIAFASLAVKFVLTQEIVAQSADQQSKDTSADTFSSADKRASGFMPMRGRKADMNFDEKRAAFTPMRGKKYQAYPLQQQTDGRMEFEEAYKRAAGFMPMRGRKSDVNVPEMYGVNGYYYQPQFEESDNEKRASGFMPMRGKKMPRLEDIEEAKRAAFHAVRGKKEFPSLSNTEWSEAGDPEEIEKRANAFHGMRGKRTINAGHF